MSTSRELRSSSDMIKEAKESQTMTPATPKPTFEESVELDTPRQVSSSSDMIKEAKESQRMTPAAPAPTAADAVGDHRGSESLEVETRRANRVSSASRLPLKYSTDTLPEQAAHTSSGNTRRVVKWGIAAVTVGIAVLAMVTSTRTESDNEEASGRSAMEQVEVESVYDGVWVIQYENGNRLRLRFTLLPNGTALKNGQGRGTWETVDGSAQIVWRDGWRDRIRPSENDSSAFENDAYRPGKTFADRPDNTATATRGTSG